MRRADLSKKDALVETNNNESVSTSFNKTITNIVISVLTVVGMFLIVGTSIYSAPYSSGLGDGSANNPYIILNLQDWNDFADDVADVFNGGFANQFFKLMADIGSEAIPVETMVTGTFSGRFDGNNKTITVRFSSSPIGLFARVRSLGGDTVVIKNLTVRGTSTLSSSHAGGFVGSIFTGNHYHFLNCTNYVNLTGNHVGGIVGQLDDGMSVRFENCYNYGDITGEHHTGGIAGCIYPREKAEFLGCHNYGKVSRDVLMADRGGAAGGIVGELGIKGGGAPHIEVKDCINNGTITGVAFGYAAGIIGNCIAPNGNYLTRKYEFVGNQNAGTVKSEVFRWTVDGEYTEEESAYYMAGIVGKISGKPKISECINIGKIFSRSSQYAGGIVGYIEKGRIEQSINSGIVDGAKRNAGGIAGYIDYKDTISFNPLVIHPVTITGCINTNWIYPSGGAGPIVGDGASFDFIFNCFYDNQMCIVDDISYRAEGRSTEEMLGKNLDGILPSSWIFEENIYPRIGNHTISQLSAAPIYLQNQENVSEVKTFQFELSDYLKTDSVHRFLWGKYDDTTNNGFLRYIDSSTNGSIYIPSTDRAEFVGTGGWDTLSVRLAYDTYTGMPRYPLPLEAPDALVFEKAVPMNLAVFTADVIVGGSLGCGKILSDKDSVLPGGSITFDIIALDECCYIEALFVNNQLIPEAFGLNFFQFTVQNIQSNISIEAIFNTPRRGPVVVYREDPYNDIRYPRPDFNYEKTNLDTVVFKKN